jgi:hypothetical protein
MNSGAKRYFNAIIVILVAVLVLGWWVFDGSTMRTRTLRSRLTLVVETPEGERSSSSVSQTTISFPGGLIRALGYAISEKLTGEAVVVDLGSHGLLFTAFETERSLARGEMANYNASLATFPQEKFRGKSREDMSTNDRYAAYLDELNRLKPEGDVPLKSLPVLVRFRDPHDPTSVQLVDPLNVAASFGPGVMLKRVFVEITDDPITNGIEARLPWLALSKVSPPLFALDPSKGPRAMSEVPLIEQLRYDDFRRLP